MSFGTLVRSAAGRLSWRTVHELGWVVVGQTVGLAGSIALTKVVASGLGVEQYGRYALGMTVAVLLNQFALGPLTTSALRFFSTFRDSGRLHPFLAALRQLVGRIAVAVGVAAIAASLYVARVYDAGWAALLAASAAFGLVQNVFSLMNNLDIAARHRVRAACYQAADPILRLAAAAAAFAVAGGTALVAMLAVTGGLVVASWSQAIVLRRGFGAVASSTVPPPAAAPEIAHATATLIRYAKYFMIGGVFAWLQLSSDRWALKFYLNDAAVGLYAVAYQIASVPSVILAGCVSQFISPIVFQRAQAGTSLVAVRAARRAILVGAVALMALTGVSSVVAVMAGERLVTIFTSGAYRAGAPYIAPLVLGLGLLQIGHMLSLLPMSSNRLASHLAVKVLHGTLAVVLNTLLVRAYGVPGLCIASIGGGLIYVLLVVTNNNRIMRTLSSDVVATAPAPLLQS